MKLGITGSRTIRKFDFSDLFCKRTELFRTFLGRCRVTRLICGGARGIDSLAETTATTLGIPITTIRPDYHRFQRGAPLKRNQQIVDQCDALLAVWNGNSRSRGTIFTIRYALTSGKRIFLVTVKRGRVTMAGEIFDDACLSVKQGKCK